MVRDFENASSSEGEELEEKQKNAASALKFKVKFRVKEEDDSNVCKICQKKFNSKKAVGGHMRVHSESQYSTGKHTGAPLEAYPCPICDKIFEGKKSLHGHMRSHPDRDYRGMIPPTNPLIIVETSLDGNYSDDPSGSSESSRGDFLGLLNRGWTTKRRGSCSSSGGSNVAESSRNNDYGPEMLNGAALVMFLANGNDSYRACKRRISENTDDDDDDDWKMYKGQIDRKGQSVIGSEDNSKIMMISETANYMKAEDSGKKRKRRAVIRDLENGKVYSCSICSKSFTTPQALGGHTSSAHNKMLTKNLALATVVEIVDDGGSDAKYGNAPVTVIGSSLKSGAHVCNKCDKAFPSGQALGGHMRLHWSGPAASVAAVVEPQGEAPTLLSSSVAREDIDMLFDLNQIPEDDDGFQGASGC